MFLLLTVTILTAMRPRSKKTPATTPTMVAVFLCGSEAAAVTRLEVVGGVHTVVLFVVVLLVVVLLVVVFLVVVGVVGVVVVEVVVVCKLENEFEYIMKNSYETYKHSGVKVTSSIAISESPAVPIVASIITKKSTSLINSTSCLFHLFMSILSNPLI